MSINLMFFLSSSLIKLQKIKSDTVLLHTSANLPRNTAQAFFRGRKAGLQPLQESPVLSHTSGLSVFMTTVQKRFCSHGHLLHPGPKMAQHSLLLREIFFALGIRLLGITTRLPASWAQVPMCVSELERPELVSVSHPQSGQQEGCLW